MVRIECFPYSQAVILESINIELGLFVKLTIIKIIRIDGP